MTTVEELVSSVRQKSSWTMDGPLLRGTVINRDGPPLFVQFYEATLAATNPDLFPAIKAYIERSARRTSSSVVAGEDLMPTVTLHTKAQRFADEFDRPVWYGEVRSFLSYQTDEGKTWRLWLDGDRLRIDDAWVDGRKVLFVDKVKQQGTFVSLSDLDNRYPGWEERWLIGTQLGLTHGDLLAQMFPTENPKQLSIATLPDISFD